jgi:phage terminase small subunit
MSNSTKDALGRAKFVEGVMMGMSDAQAYARAGYSPRNKNGATEMRKNPWVQEQLQAMTDKLVSRARMTRTKVEDIVLEAIDIARMKAEPGDMIRGASELNKMNGYYAPEEKRISVDGHIEVQQMEAMSDTELLEMLGDEPDAIEAEFERIDGG